MKRKYYLFMLILLGIMIYPTETRANNNYTGWKKEYYDIVKNYNYSEYYFKGKSKKLKISESKLDNLRIEEYKSFTPMLLNLSGKEIPELIIIKAHGINDTSNHWRAFEIYTYKNGKAIKIQHDLEPIEGGGSICFVKNSNSGQDYIVTQRGWQGEFENNKIAIEDTTLNREILNEWPDEEDYGSKLYSGFRNNNISLLAFDNPRKNSFDYNILTTMDDGFIEYILNGYKNESKNKSNMVIPEVKYSNIKVDLNKSYKQSYNENIEYINCILSSLTNEKLSREESIKLTKLMEYTYSQNKKVDINSNNNEVKINKENIKTDDGTLNLFNEKNLNLIRDININQEINISGLKSGARSIILDKSIINDKIDRLIILDGLYIITHYCLK